MQPVATRTAGFWSYSIYPVFGQFHNHAARQIHSGRRILASQVLMSEDCVSKAAANLTTAHRCVAGDERLLAWSPVTVCLRYGNWLLALGPLAVLIWVVSRYSVDVPFYDQWEFLPLLDKMYQEQLTFGDLWAQFNEHRIFFPKLLMLGLARLTHWNIRCENAASVALAIG